MPLPAKVGLEGWGGRAAGTDAVCPGAGDHHVLGSAPGDVPRASPRGSQPGGRRKKTQENTRQVINDGKKQSAAGCRGEERDWSCLRSAGWRCILHLLRVPVETLCSSGPPGSLLPHFCLSKDRKWQGSDLQEGTGQGVPACQPKAGIGLDCRSLGRTRSVLGELPTHHSHRQSVPPS